MKCPKCKTEMKEDQLYCEACGYEIQIVPVFEPEIQHQIDETLSGVAEEIDGSGKKETAAGLKKPSFISKFIHHKRFPVLFSFLVVLVIGVLLAVSVSVYQQGSYEYQLARGIKYEKMKDYGKAVSYLKNAVLLEGCDTDTVVLLADCYVKNGQKENAVITLTNGILEFKDNEEAYKKLIEIYEGDKNYEKICELLEECDNPEIVNLFQSYAAFPPEFSLTEELYDEVVPLKLSANTTGTIYYTTDESTPTKASMEYTSPIFLEEGTHHIKAIFVNQYGIISDCASRTYTVTPAEPESPLINLYNGVYNSAQFIEAEEIKGKNIYYTVDGSTPTINSNLYTGKIAMPLGVSRFKFAAIGEDGKASGITERVFELKLRNANISIQEAIGAVTLFLYQNGYLLDMEGHLPDGVSVCTLTCNTIVAQNNITYYLVGENRTDETGAEHPTGRFYAVDIRNAIVNNALVDGGGNVTIQAF